MALKRSQDHEWKAQVFPKAVDRDTDPELVPTDSGLMVDSLNTRAVSPGTASARVKVGGEELLHDSEDNRCFSIGGPMGENWFCIGSTDVLGRKFEVWADETEVNPTLIRIDGKIVAQSDKIPWVHTRPLQIERNEEYDGGEVYCTDFEAQPMIFSIVDLMANSGMTESGACTQKYFEDFVLEDHQLFIRGNADIPVFESLITGQTDEDHAFVGEGGSGLPVGLYSYSYRFSDEDGNVTAFSAPTPQIPVVARLTTEREDTYPSKLTRSSAPDSETPTLYGCRIAIRINNNYGYTRVEVRRMQWNSGDPLFAPASSVICGVFAVNPGQNTVVRIADLGGFEEDVAIEEDFDNQASIQTCKSIRYVNRRLWLGNIKYASRIVKPEDFSYVNDQAEATPLLANIGKPGHSDPWNFAYRRSDLSHEKRGFGIVFFDDTGAHSFPVPIQGLESVEVPGRRSEMSQASQDLSYGGFPIAANDDGSVTPVHEVFDLEGAVAKTNITDFHNILNVNSGKKALATIGLSNGGTDPNVPDEYLEYDTLPYPGQYAKCNLIGFRPMTPVSQSDNDTSGLNHVVNLHVSNNTTNPPSMVPYRPKGFAPRYFSKGIGFNGLQTWPEWARAYSVVRTRFANAVVAQGMAFYRLQSGGGGFGPNTTKAKNKAFCFFPDLDPYLGLNPTWFDDFAANPELYEVVFEAPYGFFSEVYAFDKRTSGSRHGIDMISYARIIKETRSGALYDINPDENPGMGIGSGTDNRYVSFSKWRRVSDGPGDQNPFFPGGQNQNTAGIVSIQTTPAYQGRGRHFEVEFDQDIWSKAGTDGQSSGDQNGVRDWHEPVYVISIRRKNAAVAQSNTTEYEYTGHYQKLESQIGISTGDQDQRFELVDERWEDCCRTNSEMLPGNPYQGLLRFCMVRSSDGIKRRWMNVTEMDQSTIDAVMTDIANNGFATVSDTTGSFDVYGVYTHVEDQERVWLRFTPVSTAGPISAQVPETGARIYVVYDNRIPVRVFSGDANVSDAAFAPIDIEYGSDGNPTEGQEFRMNVGFPYRCYNLNPRIYVVRDQNGPNKIQDESVCRFEGDFMGLTPGVLRQLVVMFVCECRTPMIFRYNSEGSKKSALQSLPLKNYVMRPYRWSPGNQDNIFPAYFDTYGNEQDVWGWGGFRFIGQVNLDYAKAPSTGTRYVSVPLVGFVERTDFRTRNVWSLVRAIGTPNSPGLRTFPAANYYDIDDNFGEIKFLHAETGSKGTNLYAITEKGVALMLLDKYTLSDAIGDENGLVWANDQGIMEHDFISRSIGCPDQLWRTCRTGGGSLFFIGRNGLYELREGQVMDKSQGYKQIIVDRFLANLADGYRDVICAGYDNYHSEYFVTFRKTQVGRYPTLTTSIGSQSLYLYSTPQIPDVPQSYYEYGNQVQVESGTVLVLSSDTVYAAQNGINIGGGDWSLFHGVVRIQVLETSPNPIRVRYNALIGGQYQLTEIAILPGTAIQFSSEQTQDFNQFGNRIHAFVAVGFQPDETGFMPDGHHTLVYNKIAGDMEDGQGMQGRYSRDFDNYICTTKEVFGCRNLKTYVLNTGFEANGEPVVFGLSLASNQNQVWSNEDVAIRSNSGRPTEIMVFSNMEDHDVADYDGRILGDNMRARQGYVYNIPRNRKDRKRIQGRGKIIQILHKLAQPFALKSISIQRKEVK